MKTLALVLTLLCGLVPLSIPALAQSAVPTTNATNNLDSLYGNWIAYSSSTVTATSGQTVTLNNCYVQAGPISGGRQFFPFATNVPVQIVDGSNTETVTPSAVQTPVIATEPAGPSAYNCSFTATFSNAHTFGPTVFVVSGDAGQAEAANDNGRGYSLSTGIQWVSGVCTGTASASTTIYLYGLGGAGAAETCTLTAVSGNPPVMYRAGVLKNLSVTAGTGGVSSSSGVFTLVKNGSATAITCTMGTGTSCTDTTHTASFVAGDVITAKFTTQGSETLAAVVLTAQAF